MKLAEKQFSKRRAIIEDKNKRKHNVNMFTYETGNGLYDIMIFSGGKFYRVNMGKWSNLITDIKPIHYMIEKHFSI